MRVTSFVPLDLEDPYRVPVQTILHSRSHRSEKLEQRVLLCCGLDCCGQQTESTQKTTPGAVDRELPQCQTEINTLFIAVKLLAHYGVR